MRRYELKTDTGKVVEWSGVDGEDAARRAADGDTGSLPDLPAGLYVDWERVARDMFCGDFTSSRASDGTVYVWRSE